jgi:hypothetical protein
MTGWTEGTRAKSPRTSAWMAGAALSGFEAFAST